MILAAALVAHWVLWKPKDIQVGVGLGKGGQEHLILLVPAEGCGAGMKIYEGHYGDFEASLALLQKSDVCALVEKRRADAPLLRK